MTDDEFVKLPENTIGVFNVALIKKSVDAAVAAERAKWESERATLLEALENIASGEMGINVSIKAAQKALAKAALIREGAGE